MKSTLRVAFRLIFISVLAAGAVLACAREGKSINVDLSWSGKQVEMSVGDLLIVTLPSDPRTGYSWSSWVSDETILQQSEHVYIGQVGTGGKEIFTFKALTEGACTIAIDYGPPQQQGEEVTSIQTFDLAVDIQ
ncbi:MAG: protease inhibitor I42 family protein [Nitrososphaerota archaeon]|nr:protease inhibitor I42 family protein [Nitrososphaerota archaeon]